MTFCSNLNEKSRKTKPATHSHLVRSTFVHRRLFHEKNLSIANVAIIIMI